MVSLRCTHKLLQRLPHSLQPMPSLSKADAPSTSPASSSPVLGDWFATLLFTRPAHLVLCVNEKSRLCLLVPAREPKHLVARFQGGLVALLHAIGVPAAALAQEQQHCQEVIIESTQGASNWRSVLGSLNEFSRMVQWEMQWREWDIDEAGLLALSLHLSGVPCGPLGYELPREVARRLLQVPTAELTSHEPAHEPALESGSAALVFRPRWLH